MLQSVTSFGTAVYLQTCEFVSLMKILIDQCTINKANPLSLCTFLGSFCLQRVLMDRNIKSHNLLVAKQS